MQQKISLFGRTKKIPFVCLVTRPKLVNHILYIMKVKKKTWATARENMRLVTYFDFLKFFGRVVHRGPMVLFHDNKSSWFIGLKQDLKKKIMEGESYIN